MGMMPWVETISTWLQLIVLVGSVVTLAVAIQKAAATPNKTQNDRLDDLERWREKVNIRLETGNHHFDDIDKGTRVTQEALLAIMSHEINGNDVEKLRDAKDKLEQYLIEK